MMDEESPSSSSQLAAKPPTPWTEEELTLLYTYGEGKPNSLKLWEEVIDAHPNVFHPNHTPDRCRNTYRKRISGRRWTPHQPASRRSSSSFDSLFDSVSDLDAGSEASGKKGARCENIKAWTQEEEATIVRLIAGVHGTQQCSTYGFFARHIDQFPGRSAGAVAEKLSHQRRF
ncbi:hypothetical protein DL93DRAFT_1679785 [Clavulina sp. PMI_390]|nr:hypothetical protein DL93DRAFT_1679785 [Clavulina sp. PMI_390]